MEVKLKKQTYSVGCFFLIAVSFARLHVFFPFHFVTHTVRTSTLFDLIAHNAAWFLPVINKVKCVEISRYLYLCQHEWLNESEEVGVAQPKECGVTAAPGQFIPFFFPPFCFFKHTADVPVNFWEK